MCSECPYAKNGRPGAFILPSGPKNNPEGLVVLGSGPTRDDVKNDEPLSGMMAKEFLATLEEAGLKREKLLIANAYACMPNEPKRDVEERKAVACCRPLLEKYTKALPPETPTLLLGKWALLAATGKEKGLFNSRGFVDQKWSLASPKASDIAEGEEQE